ncbi:tetratricopeptide repeat protein [Tumebacillus sp. BK434]|uniref:helix-turn-helix domain-containing protein n=1 Tax=Tumebacillus sp. BK434 TaxID=2512169 RepID=UPI00104FAD44|nr:helix-turn-helix transcriptional regulator [Tumebacillus sp. BK434]TCP59482.1 tetratricopeptide repeat protein [Tumebacillus sp. BK434]
MSTLGGKIRALRKTAGLSQRELADGLVTKSMISQIETDRIQPSSDLLKRIAAKLRVTPQQLMPAKHEDQERLACYKQAQAFLSLGHYAEALPLLQECLQEPHPAWPELQLTYQTAYCRQQLEAYEEARKLYEKALRLAICDEDALLATRIYVRLGEVAHSLGKLELAVVEWKRALREWERHLAAGDDLLLPLDICLSLAGGMQSLGLAQEALQVYRRAEQLLRSAPEQTRRRADVMYGSGLVLERLEQHREAEDCYAAAEELLHNLKDRRPALQARLARGRLLAKTGCYGEALSLLSECVQEAESMPGGELLVQAYGELGQVRRQMGEREQAVQLLQAGLAVTCACRIERGRIALALAGLYREQERLGEALAAAEQAQGLLQGTKEELLAVYQLLTDLYKRQDDFRLASLWAERADELIAEKTLDR